MLFKIKYTLDVKEELVDSPSREEAIREFRECKEREGLTDKLYLTEVTLMDLDGDNN